MKKVSITLITLLAMLCVSNQGFSQKKKHQDADASGESKEASKSVTGPKFKTSPTGLEYAIITHGTSTQTAKTDDFVEMHIHASCGDTIIFDSRKMNKNEPVQFQLKKPQFNSDPAEGFAMLAPGDSAIFRLPVDSIMKMGGQLPPYMKSGMKIVYNVVMVSVKTADQKKADDEAKAAKQIGIDEALLKDYLTKNNIQASKTASGLYYKITREGKGPNAATGGDVTVNYTGKTMDGKTFDSNVDSNFHHMQPFTFPLGEGHVIKGWDEGVALLNKGAKATLYIPSTLAYGERSPSPLIPANSILIFDIEVSDIKSANAKTEEKDKENSIPKKKMNVQKSK